MNKRAISYGIVGFILTTLLVSPFVFAQVLPLRAQESSPAVSAKKADSTRLEPAIESTSYDWAEREPLIAHALGGIGEYIGTNSVEALENAYNKGLRIFETDIAVTSDGQLALRHDWEAGTYNVLGQKIPDSLPLTPMTLEQFKSIKIQQHYTPMTFKELAAFMSEHPDMLLVTDTKESNSAKAADIFKRIVSETRQVDEQVLRRLIPQLYKQDNFEALSGVYPFKQYIYTLYMNGDSMKDVVDFASAKGIGVVVMDENRYTPEFVQSLKDKGIYTYINTINDVNRIHALMKQGVQGVMTDFVVPADL
ncbi:phosphatidylinositol-specific phospholipase C/glycerophosphodiester phosphodiesterase family protein [Paenibacillus nasutitermitis]|uniref:GP-PDE domain-containing protein n=1 Tax=Paenibacillus nasutitermitis TaxID=1652958 RepID=A0A917DZU4_9BACL|nr:phosphatidylinositol-specific phospholipase C/glycerophosphodiester phosphodiesterase family protein [Paenibacillus nasutitermitis]GGD86552.1 hypothetical protein GCM10010911_51280 [Paenibacillus nasutitermitis]